MYLRRWIDSVTLLSAMTGRTAETLMIKGGVRRDNVTDDGLEIKITMCSYQCPGPMWPADRGGTYS